MRDTTGPLTVCACRKRGGVLSSDGTVVKFPCGSYIGTHDGAHLIRSKGCYADSEASLRAQLRDAHDIAREYVTECSDYTEADAYVERIMEATRA